MSNNLLNEYSQNLNLDIKTSFEIYHEPTWKETGAKFNHDIWVVKQGRVYVEQDGETTMLEPGDVFMHQPARLYSAHTDEEGCTFIYTIFDIKLWDENIGSGNINVYGKFNAESVKDEYSIYINVHDDYMNSEFMAFYRMRAALELMLGKIVWLAKDATQAVDSSLKDKGGRMETVLRYIAENITKKLSVEEVAETVGMSEKYFISYFRKVVGESPYSYITAHKMEMAYNRLATGKYHVYEVAEMLGYSDIYTFSKAFKRYYGKSPSKMYGKK